MTVPEVSQLYERILECILKSKLKEAFSGIRILIQQNGFGRADELLSETENKYRYMLQYRLKGFPDAEFEKTEQGLRRQLFELASETYHVWMTRNSPSYYYDRIRINRIGGLETLQELIENIRQSGERFALVELLEEERDKEVKKAQITRFREHSAGQVFTKILVSELWTEIDFVYLSGVLLDPVIFEQEKALFVSAIMLALQKRFDIRKVLFLLDACLNNNLEVSQRALVAFVIVMYKYDTLLFLYPEIAFKMHAILDQHPEIKGSVIRVIYQLIRAKDTDIITKRMQEEILPEMTKMGSVIQDKMKEGEDLNDDVNPDWKNMMENPEFSIKMQQFSDMQLDGIDVYMSTFSTQKSYSFFLEFHNWFLPFQPSHSSLKELFHENPIEGKSVLDAVLSSDFLCSSDKFSFCFNLLQVPANYRTSMSSQMNADSEAYDEIRKSKMSMNSDYNLEQISNRYIQDLYRFFNLHNRKKDFVNPFAQTLEFHQKDFFRPFINDLDALRRIGMLYFKNNHFEQALVLLDLMVAQTPDDAELHQKRGFCYQKLNYNALALEAYLQADLIRPNSLWTIKRIANIYRLLNQSDKSLEYFQKADTLAPNDIALILNQGHVLLDAKNYAEALNVYFKAELLSESSNKTWRPIAWCSFMCRKYDQAAKYYTKILESSPTIEDFLNAGHVAWSKGNPMEAVEIYKRGIRITHTILPDFLDLFNKDYEVLIKHGILKIEIAILRDELMYQLEE